MTSTVEVDIPLFIKVNPIDNTAIIVNKGGLKEGTAFSGDLVLTEFVSQGHKVALMDIHPDEEIVRYGEVIGYAQQLIPKGSWIRESLVIMPTPPELDSLPISTKVAEVEPLEGEYTFLGYRNSDGSVGTKNLLGITTSVQCVAGVLDFAVKKLKKSYCPPFRT